jgi:type VI protein secretion system component VasF
LARRQQHDSCSEAVFSLKQMFGRKEKKHSLYYLLPGMTRANRHKRRRVFWYSVAVGLVVAAVAGGIIYWANLGPRP